MKELIKVQRTIELFGEKQMDLSTKSVQIHPSFIYFSTIFKTNHSGF